MATDESNTATVPGRYASALFELAQQQDIVADVERDFASLSTMLHESEDLQRFVRSPVFSSDQQIGALDRLAKEAGFAALTGNFVKLMARNRRLFALSDAMKVFSRLAASARGEVEAEVTSAAPLTDAERESLIERLRIAVGRDVRLNAIVDPGILGGLIVKVGSRMIDSSLRTKLASLKTRMKEVG